MLKTNEGGGKKLPPYSTYLDYDDPDRRNLFVWGIPTPWWKRLFWWIRNKL